VRALFCALTVRAQVESIQMQNIVGHADMELVGAHLDLARFYADHNIECTFQRSMFPGLVFRSSKSNVVLLVFRSGRIVLTGGRDVYCLNSAWWRMLPELQGYVVADAGAESAGGAAAVYGAAGAGRDAGGARAGGHGDGDVPAERGGTGRRGGGRRGVAGSAREAAFKPPHDGGA